MRSVQSANISSARRRPNVVEPRAHLSARLSRLDAAIPGRDRRREGAELFRNLAHALGADLVARRAAARLERSNPLRLRLHGRRDAVPGVTGAGKLALVGHFHQREPVACRVVLGGRPRIGRRHRREVQDLAGHRLHLRRIDEPVSAHPHVVAGLRQIREEIAPAIVGDDDLHELRRQVGGLRDDPHARFRPFRPRHGAAEVVVVDRNRAARLLSAHRASRDEEKLRRRAPRETPTPDAAFSYALPFFHRRLEGQENPFQKDSPILLRSCSSSCEVPFPVAPPSWLCRRTRPARSR